MTRRDPRAHGRDDLGGADQVELPRGNEFADLVLDFEIRELSPAWDGGIEPDTDGAIDSWQRRSKSRAEYAMESSETEDDHALAFSHDPNGSDRERGQGCKYDERDDHEVLIG